ncbi:MAG: hypothetical protein NVS4B3_17880 [Gemmatimonadaceae bacterium]
MNLSRVTYTGGPIDDAEVLDDLPSALAALLRETNGFVAFGGGLHLRGACREPNWHSLRAAWGGPTALAARYRTVHATDVPFAEDVLGDQFLLRDGVVHRMAAETGEIESLGVEVMDFLQRAAADPLGYLSLEPLVDFERSGGTLEPGQLLTVYPPFCTQAAGPRSIDAIPAADRLAFLAELAAQLHDLPDGGTISFKIAD